MEIVVLGAGCVKCKNVYDIVEKVVKETGINASLHKEGDIMKIMEYNIMRTPAIVIDGEVIFQGCVPSEKEIKVFLLAK